MKIKYFKEYEYICKCGCGKALINPESLLKLDKARELAGVSFSLNSAYRCEKHNKSIGGVPNSAHTRGFAFDIACIDSVKRYKIIDALLMSHFNRIGVYKDFIHVDDDPSKPKNVIWYK